MKKLLPLIPLSAIVLVFVVNLGTVGVAVPREIGTLARLTGLNQKWTLFAPHPPRAENWLVIPATLADGTEVNLFTGDPVSYEKPALAEHRFSNQRWGRLIGRVLREPALSVYKERFASYLCGEWNSAHPENPARSLSIYMMREYVPAPGEVGAPESAEPEKEYEGRCHSSATE